MRTISIEALVAWLESYCSDRDCAESPRAAAILEELGYREVFHFEGGIGEWRRRGLPVLRSVREADRS